MDAAVLRVPPVPTRARVPPIQLSAQAEAGLTALDFGDIYSGVEVLVGRYVRGHVAAGRARSELQLHTKLVPDLDRLATFDAAAARAVVQRSCARLHTSYIDLLQFHCDARREPHQLQTSYKPVTNPLQTRYKPVTTGADAATRACCRRTLPPRRGQSAIVVTSVMTTPQGGT